MIVLGKQVREVWKIPRIPPRASPSEEYSEFPDFSSMFTQDYYKLTRCSGSSHRRGGHRDSGVGVTLEVGLGLAVGLGYGLLLNLVQAEFQLHSCSLTVVRITVLAIC